MANLDRLDPQSVTGRDDDAQERMICNRNLADPDVSNAISDTLALAKHWRAQAFGEMASYQATGQATVYCN